MLHTTVRRFAKYTSLSVLGMIGLSCYILADTFFISNRVGALGLAALNIAIPMYSVISGLGLMLGVGGATQFAIHRARNDRAGCDRAFTHVLIPGLVIGVLLMLLGLTMASPLAQLLGADGQTQALTAIYLRVLLSFAPFFILNNIMVAFVRNDGVPQLAMVSMLIGTLLNVVLDYVFIYPMQLGMFGAALATGVSPIVSSLILLTHFRGGKSGFALRRCKPEIKVFGNCCALGTSAFVGEISSSVVILTFNLILLRLSGNMGVAAYGVIANVAYVALSIFNGVTQGMQPLISESYARGDKAEEQLTRRCGLLTALAIGVGIWSVALLFAPQITAIFNSEEDAMLAQIAEPGLRIYFLGFVFSGLNLVFAAAFAATEQVRASFIVSILRGLVAIVALVLLLSALFGVRGVWMSFPCAEAMTLLVALGIYRRSKNRALLPDAAQDKGETQ